MFVLALTAGAGVARAAEGEREGLIAAKRIAAVPSPAPTPASALVRVARARPAPADLPVIDYWGAPGGFPRDGASGSVAALGEGLRPLRRLAVYDAPGGRPRAFLPRRISGLEVTVPIVQRRPGWVAVLLPSLNRRLGWIPGPQATSGGGGRPGEKARSGGEGRPGDEARSGGEARSGEETRSGEDGRPGWVVRPLRDQLVVHRRERRLVWLRDGRPEGEWTAGIGAPRTATPLGRTFVMGRTITRGDVYAGLDALVLGAVPDDREALAPGLRDGHTGIHAWRDRSAFGRGVSNGCVRLPADAQRALLRHIGPGTPVHIVE
ncbi:hypothetical protein Ade02nite_47670 [Paractinoplanes deccanensis]|uniref:L,D-TPase catalytic domain-containing protein n=1 Tax=Paractinoplanes deccanensis TaxID=113561 RepID=A0ABQ3Y818_9ACTN|nr:hypothetical protein Ade02nite_47670 [Actinoplanes deccanensis]